MNFKEILDLIDKVAASGISAVEIEQAGTKVRIEGKQSPQVTHTYTGEVRQETPAQYNGTPSAATTAAAPPPAAAAPIPELGAGLHVITSPIVGTFYRSPSPESQAFVNVGDRIKKGQVICIVEAMKLMNEIESDIDGVVAEIYPQNGQAVEYGQPLFGIKV